MQTALISLSVLAVALGILTFILFQRTFITLQLHIFISSPPKEVFDFIKEPKNLPDIHHKTKSAQLKRLLVDPDGTEHREFVTTEEFHHIGLQTVTMRSSADPENFIIHLSSMALYSLLRSHAVFGVKPYQSSGRQGTLVTESIDIYVPYAMKGFINRTISETHNSMLDNLKFILERTFNVDKQLNSDFERLSPATTAQPTSSSSSSVVDDNDESAHEKTPLSHKHTLPVDRRDFDEDDAWDLFHKN